LQIWLVAGLQKVFYSEPDLDAFPVGDLGKASAHWVARDLLAWRTEPNGAQVSLHFSESAALESEGGKLLNGPAREPSELPLSYRKCLLLLVDRASYPN
jgi:hypothetical protein